MEDAPKKRSLTQDEKKALQLDQVEELKRDQLSVVAGESEAQTSAGNRNSAYAIRDVEKESYVHVLAITKNDNPQTKSYDEQKQVIKIHKREFDKRVKEGAFQTFDHVEVVHDPRENAPTSYSLKPNQIDVKGAQKEYEESLTNKVNPNVAAREKALNTKERAVVQKTSDLNEAAADLAAKQASFEAEKAQFEKAKQAAADLAAKQAEAPAV